MIVEHNQSSYYKDPYPTTNTGTYDNKWKFNGKELDDATGMYYYGARYYDPRISIFISVDPLAEHPNQRDKTPYNYTWNNPVNLTDPDGKCPDCPSPTYLPLAESAYYIEEGQKSSNGWTAIRVDTDKSGYRAVLFQGEYDGKTQHIYATAGSDDVGDWVNNASQLSGNSAQYSRSVAEARALANDSQYEGVSFTGHSLGGGLASANALATEGKAITFNAAGLSNKTKENLSLNGNTASIIAFIVKGEIVDWAQKNTLGLNRAEGEKVTTPPVYRNWNNINRARNHMIDAVQESFNMYVEGIIDSYKKSRK